MADLNRIDPEIINAARTGLSNIERILTLLQKTGSSTQEKTKVMAEILRMNDVEQIKKSTVVPGVSVENIVVTSTNRVRIKLYKPDGKEGNLPCLYHIHGGGMVSGSVDKVSTQISSLSKRLDVAVASVEYRLAPENPYPSALNDCYEGFKWISEHAENLTIDPEKIGLFGESAGGGLAAALSLKNRDEVGLSIAFQVLAAPMLDHRNSTASSIEFSGLWPTWPRELNVLGWSSYLGKLEDLKDVSPYASPSLERNLKGLPPSYIEVGALEVFRDEDIEYAKGLLECGNEVQLHVYSGAYHGFYTSSPDAKISVQTLRNRMEWINRKFGR